MYFKKLRFTSAENEEQEKLDYDLITHEVIQQFLKNYLLMDVDMYQWQLLRLAFSGDFSVLSAEDRENLITFYEDLNDLITAVYYQHKVKNDK